jgi:hypothetical protein
VSVWEGYKLDMGGWKEQGMKEAGEGKLGGGVLGSRGVSTLCCYHVKLGLYLLALHSD